MSYSHCDCNFTCAMRHLVVEDENVREKEERTGASKFDDTACELTVNLPRNFVDLRELILDNIRKHNVFVSFELFPVRSNHSLYDRFFSVTGKYLPLFYSLTWHGKSLTGDHESLKLMTKFPSNAMLHIAGRGLKRNDVKQILEKAVDAGIRCIFALQGDNAEENGDFPYAINLVSFIRHCYGTSVCICVAGYPQMHPRSLSKESDLLYLKKKIDAGADFIITQIFFESSVFINFVKDCRKVGITVPILPGIFPIIQYRILQRMSLICKVEIPSFLLESLEVIKENDEAVFNFGVAFAAGMISDILSSDTACGFHIFSLNNTEAAAKICERINILRRNHSGPK